MHLSLSWQGCRFATCHAKYNPKRSLDQRLHRRVKQISGRWDIEISSTISYGCGHTPKPNKPGLIVPSSSSLISLEAWMPSSFRFLSICRLRAAAARSSADWAHPMSAAVPELDTPAAPTPQPGALSPLPLHALYTRPAAPDRPEPPYTKLAPNTVT